jgi:hypothetical protein
MKTLSALIPEFKEQRKSIYKDVQFPAPLHLDESAYQNELEKLKHMCYSLDQIEKIYATEFDYSRNFESFKNKLLPIIIKMSDEKSLARDLQARWLAENNVQIQLTAGVKLNREKELSFLLDAYDFPKELTKKISSIFRLIRNCFIADGIKFSQLYDDEKKQFFVPKAIEEKIKAKHTIFAKSADHFELLYLRYQLADALNGLAEKGFGLGHIPYPLTKLLTVNGTTDSHTSTGKFFFKVNPNDRPVKILPTVKIVEGSIQDPNDYNEDGSLKYEFEPITLQAEVDGVVQDLKLNSPQLIIPGYSAYDSKKGPLPIKAKDMVSDEKILQELISNKSAIEQYNMDIV